MDTMESAGRAERIHRAMGLMMHAMRMHHRIVEKRIDGLCAGIHHSQHRMLMYLSKMGRAESQKDVAKVLNVTPACVARALKSLTAAGMVKRDEGAQDGRCNEVCLTEAGKKVVSESEALFQTLDLEMYAGFSDEEINTLTALMERLKANLARMDAAGDESEQNSCQKEV